MLTSISIITILDEVINTLVVSLDEVTNNGHGEYQNALGKCNDAVALLNLINIESMYHVETISLALRMLHCLYQEFDSGELSAVGKIDSEHKENLIYSNINNMSTFPIKSFIENHSVTFRDIIGCDRAKHLLEENVVLQLTLPCLIKTKALRGILNGLGNVLLHGPPGTGKTLLAQAAANEAGATFITVRPSDVLSKYQGDSEKFVHNLFQAAKSIDRAVLFFDEFDSMATSRHGSEDNGLTRRLLSELLLQLTTLHLEGRERKWEDNAGRLVVIAATNRIEDIDEAVIRRFESKVYVGVPNKSNRILLIINFLKNIEYCLSDADLNHIADITFGWSASDLETITREAAMIPFREFLEIYSHGKFSSLNIETISPPRPVHLADFDAAVATIVAVPLDGIDQDECQCRCVAENRSNLEMVVGSLQKQS